MLRRALIALVLPAALLVPLTQAQGAPTTAAALPAACTETSWVAGSVDLCDGTLVYRDYVYDDEGADSGDTGYASGTNKAFGSLAPPAGDVRYPAGDVNSADLVRLELRRAGDRVEVTAELNALFHPGSTVLALAVDTDGRAGTGGGAWPGLGDPQRRLGPPVPDHDGRRADQRPARLVPAAGRGVLAGAGGDRAGRDRHGHERRLPRGRRARGVPAAAERRLALPLPGPGRVVRGRPGRGAAGRRRLALRAGRAHRRPAPGVSRAQQVGPGLHERVYTSRHTIAPGEGMSYAGVPGRGDGGDVDAGFAQVFNFLGKYQPYGIWVPGTAAPHGLQMEWHGSNQGIVAQINQPGMQRAYGEELDRLLVTPLARGPNGYGSDISERDLLDVMDDVQRHYAVDRDRVFSSGYSQGGYITYRMAMLYPDRFAGFTSWVGFTGDDFNGTPLEGEVSLEAGAVGNMVRYTENLRHVPGSMIYAGADELVQVPSARAMEQAFAATDDVYRWYLHPVAEHLTFAGLDDWDKEAAYSRGQRLVRRPARVTFLTNPHLDAPTLGIRHDRAYWVSRLRGREPGDLRTDLTSHGCGGTVPVLGTTSGSGPAPLPWVSTEQRVTGTRTLAPAALLAGTLENVGSLRVDAAATCLTRAFDYRITSDGPAVLRLSDGRSLRLTKGLNTGRVRAA